MTFEKFSQVNLERCKAWHPGFPNDAWTGADWSNAMCGEAGEAANVVKKLRRQETGAEDLNLEQRTRILNYISDRYERDQQLSLF